MSFLEDNVCDVYCTSCKIWYLRLMRPGDTVPFKLSKRVLPIGITQCGLGILIIVLDILIVFCQSRETAAPVPSLLGSPATPTWLSVLFICAGVFSVVSYKRKERFMTAVGFLFSILSLLTSVALVAICMMGIAQEADFYSSGNSVSGLVVGSVLMATAVAEFVVTGWNTLVCYLALSSHDDRWFTDRGTQYNINEVQNTHDQTAKVIVPSGQPAFLFYSPSNEAAKYSSALQDVLTSSLNSFEQSEHQSKRNRHLTQKIEVAGQTSQHAPKQLPGNYLSTPVN